MNLQERTAAHAALGDEGRLRLVDLLSDGDLTVRELGTALGMPGNLLAHHLNVLEEAGVIARRDSDGDRRRRYVTLRREVLDGLIPLHGGLSGSVVFVCSHNSARSQYAAAYWNSVTGGVPVSAGSHPSAQVHPTAIRVALERGIDLSAAVPRGYESITFVPDVLISVCDRARQEPLPEARRRLHWSIPDPLPAGKVADFRSVFDEVERRVGHLMKGR
jgi:ArsR family transcriptional regulator, arsenate/arsenite/antimonite-responsive transcriptional repressor / arsenate reductase (thioredoxin)